MEISKELFFEVKEFKEFDFNYVYDVENEKLEKGMEFFYFICKDWAFDNFYLSIIVFKINDDLYKCEIADIKDSLGEWNIKHSFKIETEIAAVIKACQWMLDNKKGIK